MRIKKFDQLSGKMLKEEHEKTREEQIDYICSNINDLNDDEIEYIYNHLYAKLIKKTDKYNL